jgi:hypothetical protein
MGGSTSQVPVEQIVQIATMCKYQKQDFNTKINVIKDAHTVLQFYASILLKEKMPVQLPEYKNYSDVSEDYFNQKRKDQYEELSSINPKINNYYDFYNALRILQQEYERGDITENERRSKILNIFDISYAILKKLIEELSDSCEMQ